MNTREGTMSFELAELQSNSASRETAWAQLYRRHLHGVHRVLSRSGAHTSDLDDLAQKVFVIAYERIDQLDHLQPGGWLRGIALRVLAGHRRWEKRRQDKANLLYSSEEARVVRSTPETRILSALTSVRARKVLLSLKPAHREVLVLCDVEGYRVSEAAEILDIPVNTVRSRRAAAQAAFARRWTADQRRRAE